MTVAAGNTACTTGLSAAIYNAWVADANSGFSASLTTAQTNMIKAQCYDFAQAIAAAVNSTGLNVSDGTHSGDVGQLVFSGATVSVSGGVATVTVSGGSLPTASAAGEALVSTGAGTTYTAQLLAPACLDVAVPTTGLLLQLRADLGVTLDGAGNVSAWADQSGAGNNATQSSSGNRPHLVLGAYNGRPTVRFDGSSSWMSIADNAAYKLSSVVAVVVCRSAAGSTVVLGYPYASTHATPYFDWVLYNAAGNVVNMRVGSQNNTITNGDANGLNCWPSPHLYVLDNEDSTASSQQTLWRNGGDAALYSGTGAAITYPNATGIFLGAHASGLGEYLKGDLSEFLLYDGSQWTAAIRAGVQQALATRWGLRLDGQ